MIRFRIQELLAEKHFSEGRRVTLLELSQATGINRVTLSKMVNQRGYSTVTDNLDKLCKFFGCNLEQLAVYVPDEAGNENRRIEQ
jgi:DNA-binding Xre family transcriptional regulator